MRPYMQWLAVVYANRDRLVGHAGRGGAAVVEDWVSYQHDQRRYVREALRWSIAGSVT